MTDFAFAHMLYLMNKTEIEQFCKTHVDIRLKQNPTATAVFVVEGSVPERYPAILCLKAEGYYLVDTYTFGLDGDIIGETWLFEK